MGERTSNINESTINTWGTRHHLRAAFRTAVAVAVAVLLLPERHTLLDGARRLSRISPMWLLLAVAAEVVAFLAAAELQRLLLAAIGVDIGRLPSLRLVSAAWSVSAALPAGVAFSAAYTYRQLIRRGGWDRTCGLGPRRRGSLVGDLACPSRPGGGRTVRQGALLVARRLGSGGHCPGRRGRRLRLADLGQP
jgi:hypothetical protein